MYYRQPGYFNDFYCVGGACQSSCCANWRIDWKASEVDKLRSAGNASPQLRELIEKSFVLSEAKQFDFRIDLTDSNDCPFHNEEGLCCIQKELGEDYLSHTCRVYPRFYFMSRSVVYRYCRLTCPYTMELLLNNEKAADLVNKTINKEENLEMLLEDTDSNLKKRPDIKYFNEIFEFFYGIISDKRHSVEDSIVLGALAAQALTKLAEGGDIDRIPETLKLLNTQMHNGAQLKQIENIKPNYSLKLGFLSQLTDEVSRDKYRLDTMTALKDDEGKFNIDLYNEGERRLNDYLQTKPYAMRNIALNLLFELTVPFKSKDFNIFENYAEFAVIFAMFKLNTISVAELDNRADSEFRKEFDMETYFIRSGSIISRTLCQTVQTSEIVRTTLRDRKMLSPAYLALLVK